MVNSPASPGKTRRLSTEQQARLRTVRHVALDMDGTIYSGGSLFPFTLPFLDLLTKLRIGYTFLTNNSSKSSADYLVSLKKLGIHASEDKLYSSTLATLEYLRENLPEVRRLFLLGTPSLAKEVQDAGFTLTADNPTDEPDAVVVGFDMTLTYARLCRAAYWVKRGKKFIATHPDLICPTDQPTVLVDCGAMCSAIEKATGRSPDVVLGKPDPCMIRGILARHALAPGELAMVGDRLYTDMAMARRAGAFGVLVLSGEATMEDAAKAIPGPDLILQNLEEFSELLHACR
jgi:HAD superfamily hydrolase (TIGR01450 family)